MFCRYCGNNIVGDSIFCEVCGKRLRETPKTQPPIRQEPVYQAPIIQQPVYTAPVRQEPIIKEEPKYDSNNLLHYYDNSNVKPTDTKPSPTIEYKGPAEATVKPRKKKNLNFLPYLILPFAIITGMVVADIFQTLAIDIYSSIVEEITGEPYWYKNVTSAIWGVVVSITYNLTYIISLVAASFCCKGIYKKSQFVGSVYAGQITSIISTFFAVIVGYVILYTTGFYEWESYMAFSNISSIGSAIISLLILPGVSLLMFTWSQKYTVKKEEKAQPVHIILPAVFIGVYFLISVCLSVFAFAPLRDFLFTLFDGEYANIFAEYLISLIVTGTSYLILILLSIACKGGYRKVAFIGSIFFSNAVFGFVPSVAALIGTLINDSYYSTAYTIGQFVQIILAIPVAVFIYILLNKYAVVKVEKKKELQ